MEEYKKSILIIEHKYLYYFFWLVSLYNKIKNLIFYINKIYKSNKY